MVNEVADKLIQQTEADSIGNDNQPLDKHGVAGAMPNVLVWLTRTGSTVPPWWSRARDQRLSSIWKESPHLSLAMYNTQAKLVGIPFRIVPKDPSNPEHIAEAENLTYLLRVGSEFGKSWAVAYAKFVEDLLSSDNGAFMEIVVIWWNRLPVPSHSPRARDRLGRSLALFRFALERRQI